MKFSEKNQEQPPGNWSVTLIQVDPSYDHCQGIPIVNIAKGAGSVQHAKGVVLDTFCQFQDLKKIAAFWAIATGSMLRESL